MFKLGCLAVAGCGLAVLAHAEPSKFEALKTWVCRVFRFDPKVYQRLVGVREGHQQMAGSRLMIADLQAQTVSELADCGACWSPAVVGNRIFVVKEDGLWEAKAGSALRRAVAADGIEMILGGFHGDASLIVLKTGPSQESCPHKLALIDLASGKLEAPPDGAPECLEETDVGALARPGTLRGNLALRTTSQGSGARRLLIEELASGDAPGGGRRRALLPWMDAKDDGIDRFDAVWSDDTHVVFLEKQ